MKDLLKAVISEIVENIEDAIDFRNSELEPEWEEAEYYYKGGVYLEDTDGRSLAVKTEVRDTIRAALPSVMRVLYQSRKPVEFTPSSIDHAAFIEQQGLYINQLFTACGGYRILYNTVLQAMKLKIGPMKVWWEEDPAPQFIRRTAISEEQVQELKDAPDIEVLTVESSPNAGELSMYDVTARKYYSNGKIVVEDFPVWEFFFSRSATSLETAKVHGHQRTVTVSEAMDMGLEYDGEWSDLAGEDPETANSAQQAASRRGYYVSDDEKADADPLQDQILLTEAYVKYDLNEDGKTERYVFYFGGEDYKYISHHEIADYCIDAACVDPQPYTIAGNSIADIAIPMQDNESSILRAIIDNAHMANNPRYAANPRDTDFDDLMAGAVGAPIKHKGNTPIQVVDVPFTGGALIPFLQYMEQDTEERVGVTKAATGLDSDAMQSTNKEAVQNTIALSQGQIELMVRNIIETALIPMFRKMLRLSVAHMDPMQVVRTKGVVLPINLGIFDADLAAEPNVGLGTAGHNEKMATLNFILSKQEQIIQNFGMDNPFTSLTQIYNTLEDLTEIGGIRDPGRYFTVVTKAIEQQIAQQKAEQAAEAAKNAPPDPTTALLQIEEAKGKLRELEIQVNARVEELKLAQKALKDAEDLDIKRDQMDQDRYLAIDERANNLLNGQIEQQQKANDDQKSNATSPAPSSSGPRIAAE